VLNPFHEVNWRPGRPERRKFALSLVVGFPCVATALLVAQRGHTGTWAFSPALTLAAAGVTLGAILGAFPQIARPFYVVWYGVACALGFLTGNALLAAVYFLLVTPTGWVRRAHSRPAFEKRVVRGARIFWRDAPPPAPAARSYRQF
jgi:hypothetical protein